MQIKVSIDKDQLSAQMTMMATNHQKALASALRSESHRILQCVKDYARDNGGGAWGPFAPITLATRKGSGYGAWIARWARYYVDPDNLTARIGILGKLPNARFAPISREFIASAERLVDGYEINFTLQMQRRMAKHLMEMMGSAKSKRSKAYKRGKLGIANLPRVGIHRVKARPFAEPVMEMEQGRTRRNIKALYMTKMAGKRWASTWAEDWGND